MLVAHKWERTFPLLQYLLIGFRSLTKESHNDIPVNSMKTKRRIKGVENFRYSTTIPSNDQ